MLAFLLTAFLLPANAQDTAEPVPPPVVGGVQSQPGVWPGVVAVFGGGACTGTLVGPRTVITAAHCGRAQGVMVNTTNYYDQSQGTWYPASSTTEHPSYGSSQYGGYDIEVVTLQNPVDPSHATPFPMAFDCAADKVFDGATSWIVGFGQTTETGTGNNSLLHEAQLPIVDADCSEDWLCDPNMVQAGELFAGGDGVDACFGDSGGPLFVRTDAGEYALVGVTSRSGSQATQNYPCRTGGIWTRADTLSDWVQSVAVDTLQAPTCNLPPEVIVQAFGDVGNKGNSTTTFAINDPDSASWTYEIPVQPTWGSVGYSGNELIFTGDEVYIGADSFVFRVTDDYGNVVDTTIPLNIVDGQTGCGCSTGGPSALWSLGLVGLVLLRRRD